MLLRHLGVPLTTNLADTGGLLSDKDRGALATALRQSYETGLSAFDAQERAGTDPEAKLQSDEDAFTNFGLVLGSTEVGIPAGKSSIAFGKALTARRVGGRGPLSKFPTAISPLGDYGEDILFNGVQKGEGKTQVRFGKIAGFGSEQSGNVDVLLDGIANEAKAGKDVKLSSVTTQIDNDAAPIKSGRIAGAHWHSFNGATPETLAYLSEKSIQYTLYGRFVRLTVGG